MAWACQCCTYLNPDGLKICDACSAPHSADVSSAPVQSTPSMTCPTCTYMNNASAANCEMCLTPLGAPRDEKKLPPVACGKCTHQNEPSSKECTMCRYPLPNAEAHERIKQLNETKAELMAKIKLLEQQASTERDRLLDLTTALTSLEEVRKTPYN